MEGLFFQNGVEIGRVELTVIGEAIAGRLLGLPNGRISAKGGNHELRLANGDSIFLVLDHSTPLDFSKRFQV